MLKPMEDKVVVKTIKEEQTTASGFVIASLGEEKPQEAIVVAVGPGLMLGNGQMMIPDVKVGDKVLFSKYQGTEISNDGEDYLILAYRDIFAVLD
jgi:chaperonin GroES